MPSPMRWLHLLLVPALLAACTEEAPPVETPPQPAAPAAETGAPPAAAADAAPTTRTEAQLAADKALEPSAIAVVGAFFNATRALSKDNKRLLFASDRSGVMQLYLGDVDKKADAPIAITKGQDRATFGDFTRDGKWILFSRDHNNDEFFHLYRVGLDGSGEKDLTPGKLRNDAPILAPKKPDLLVYFRHPVVDPSSELVVGSVAGGEPKVVYKDPGLAFLDGISADGKQALIQHTASSSSSWLVLVDTESGKTRRIYPAEGVTEGIGNGDITPDGKTIFASTDGGADKSIVKAIDAATGKVVATYEETKPKTAQIVGVFASPAGDRVAVQIDAGSYGEVRVLDTKKLNVVTSAKVPLGSVNGGLFSMDGKTELIDVAVPDSPQEAYKLDVATGAVSKLREDKRPGLEALTPIDASIVNIAAFDGLQIPTNVYVPKGPTQKRPVIVNVHGGPAGNAPIGYDPINRFYLGQGFAVVEPNMRGSTGFGRSYEMADNKEKRGDVLKDLERVNAWVKQQPWCDPDRVVIFGASYGGYVTLLALTRQPKLWRAGVDLFGIADLPTFMKVTDQAIKSLFVTEFGDPDKDAELLKAWSPLKDAGNIAVPLFVYAGANDPRVPRPQSDAIVKAAREHKVAVEYMIAANEGHSLSARQTQIEFMTRSGRFLKDAMK
jgi:dipeptidyl aminopeptidase/acylaminoacyl peptidase